MELTVRTPYQSSMHTLVRKQIILEDFLKRSIGAAFLHDTSVDLKI
jgi:hypothetical protein